MAVFNEHDVAQELIPSFMGGTMQANFPDYWPDLAKEWEKSD